MIPVAETRNQGIGTNGSPYMTIGGDSVIKNDLSHIYDRNPDKNASFEYQVKRKRIELIN